MAPPRSPSLSSAPAFASLEDIRREIDRIDEQMQALLIERSAVISDLIAIKKVAPPADGDPRRRSSAFRPAREAAMMRAIVERHGGLLPVDTVESIWRVIISTFTYVQAPYEVMYAVADDAIAMRDSARFHFGFSVPLRPLTSPQAVLDALGSRADALGIIPLSAPGAWWDALAPEEAPKVIARVPFVDRADHPAGTPCLIVANAPIDRDPSACRVASLADWQGEDLPDGVERLASSGSQALVSLHGAAAADALLRVKDPNAIRMLGSHAAAFRFQDRP